MEDEAPNSKVNVIGRTRRPKGFWKRGVVETNLNTVDMTAWVHTECDILDEDALFRLQGAWENSEQKDECIVRMNELERDYWMGTEVGQCTSRQRRGRNEFEQAGIRGVVLALQSAALSEDVLLLCDNAAVLCAIKKWVGEERKATLATAQDADILREIVCLLTQRVRAGRATFFPA